MAANHTHQRPISIKPPAVAGSFYPVDTNQLSHMLDEYLMNAAVHTPLPKAIIAPHAGYTYSGEIAASIYSSIKASRNRITRVVLMGPAHRVYIEGIALPSNTHFATPLGNIPIDTLEIERLKVLPSTQLFDEAFEQEHSLEVHLPFLQKVLNDFILIPLLVGKTEAEDVSNLLDQLWGNDETLIIISSDLSHFHDYDTAVKEDAYTNKLIENFEYKKIGSAQACGSMPMRGLLRLAQQKNMIIENVDLRNSGDTAGSKDRVVGYGAYALFNNLDSNLILNDENKRIVFDLIDKSILQGLENNHAYKPDKQNYSPELTKKYAVFITLKLNGQLRGCIGTTEAHSSLISAVSQYAYAAAFADPRFKPLSKEEYKQLEISLSILTPARSMNFADEAGLLNQLQPNIDGLIIAKGSSRATFLPVVWESLKQPEQFLHELKKKAGIKPTDSIDKAWRYQAEYYS